VSRVLHVGGTQLRLITTPPCAAVQGVVRFSVQCPTEAGEWNLHGQVIQIDLLVKDAVSAIKDKLQVRSVIVRQRPRCDRAGCLCDCCAV
jgi:hypothetical protein